MWHSDSTVACWNRFHPLPGVRAWTRAPAELSSPADNGSKRAGMTSSKERGTERTRHVGSIRRVCSHGLRWPCPGARRRIRHTQPHSGTIAPRRARQRRSTSRTPCHSCWPRRTSSSIRHIRTTRWTCRAKSCTGSTAARKMIPTRNSPPVRLFCNVEIDSRSQSDRSDPSLFRPGGARLRSLQAFLLQGLKSLAVNASEARATRALRLSGDNLRRIRLDRFGRARRGSRLPPGRDLSHRLSLLQSQPGSR